MFPNKRVQAFPKFSLSLLAHSRNCGKRLLGSSCFVRPVFRLRVCRIWQNSSAPAEEMFMKFGIWPSDASSPLCYKQLGRGCGTSQHNCLVSYLLCWRRHVSATVGHLQVTKIYIEANFTECDLSTGAYCKLSTRSLRRLGWTYWAKSTSSKWSIKLMDIYIYIYIYI